MVDSSMKKKLISLVVALSMFLSMATVILAVDTYGYYMDISITDTSGTARTYVNVATGISGTNLYNAGYIAADGMDTRVRATDGVTDYEYMIVSNQLVVVIPSLSAYQTLTIRLYLDFAPVQTNIPMVLGTGGYVTTTDAAALEPANNFQLEISGRFKAPASEQTLVSKGGNFEVTVDENMDIDATIWAAEAVDQNHMPDIQNDNVYGVNWFCQTFKPSVTGLLTALGLNLEESGNPSGNMNIGIYAVDGSSKPTGAALGSYTKTATDVGAHAEKTYTLDTPASLTSATEYAIVISVPSGDISNSILWYRNHTSSPNSYANGVPGASTDSGSTWTMSSPAAGVDRSFKTYMSVPLTVTASGMATGEHTLKVTADTTNFKIYYDASEEDTVALAGASITNNATDWIFLANNVMPYTDYLSLTIGGTLTVHYHPAAMISGTTLPDLEGTAQNGTITFGSNANLDVSVGALTSYAATTPGEELIGQPPGFVQDFTQPAGWYASGTGSGLPFYSTFNTVATQMGMTTQTFYLWFIFALAACVGVVVVIFTGSTLMAAVGCGIIIMAGVDAAILSGWMLLIYACLAIGVIYLTRKA